MYRFGTWKRRFADRAGEMVEVLERKVDVRRLDGWARVVRFRVLWAKGISCFYCGCQDKTEVVGVFVAEKWVEHVIKIDTPCLKKWATFISVITSATVDRCS